MESYFKICLAGRRNETTIKMCKLHEDGKIEMVICTLKNGNFIMSYQQKYKIATTEKQLSPICKKEYDNAYKKLFKK